MADGPLAGVMVLDFSTVGPAARCARILGDYGAHVIKVAAPPPKAGGAKAQIIPPFYAYSGHRGMQRISIDLKTAAGKDAFLRLADSADVIIESFRPGVVDQLGIGYEAVEACNPSIVYCSTSGYGQSGPYAKRAGHDINYLAAGGYLHAGGRAADGGPPLPGATVADAAAGGMHAAMAICAALFGRAETGEGAYLDVSVADGALWLMSLYVDQQLATGEAVGPGHDVLTGRYACYGLYESRDHEWLAVGAIEAKFFANLCRALGLEAWAPRQYDDEAQNDLRKAMRAAFRRRTQAEWVDRLADADCCVNPVQSIGDVIADQQFEARGAFVEAKHTGDESGSAAFRQVGPVFAGQPPVSEPVEVRDATATDVDEILAQAGFDKDEINELRDEGIVS